MRAPTLQHFASRLCRSERSRWLISNVHVNSRIYPGGFNLPRPNTERSHSTGPASSLEDGQIITPTAFQWSPLPNGNNGSSESPTISAAPTSFEVLCSAMGGATHEHLQQLASAIMVPRHGSSVLSRANVLPADSGWVWSSRQIVKAMARVDFDSTDTADLARELVAATLLAAKTRTPGPGAGQWARGLLGSALYQYREIDSRLEFEDADFGLKCLDMYTQMLDLLAAWNLCCEKHQTTAENYNSSYSPGPDVYAGAQKPTYKQRFMSFLPGWSSSSSSSYKVSSECEQDLVFASFITLALITKLRYRMLRGLDVDTAMAAEAGTGALASTDASLLNLRNVSLPEAAFLRLVGQAGQGTPFNRIHLRLAWARIGCSPAESLSIGRTIDNLHAYHDYLLMEAERCFSQAAVTGSKAGSDSGSGAGSARAKLAEEEETGFSSPDANAIVPAPLLAWIHYANAPALRRFRDGLSKSSSISVHAIWPELLSAITQRFVTIGQQQQSAEASGSGNEAAGDILRTLKVWVALGQAGPCEGDALKVLDHFQEAHDDMSYATAWSTLRRCQQDGSLEAHFRRWVRQLWAQKEYDRVVSLHRHSVRLLSEKLCGDNDYARSLTHICLELHVQDPARGVYVQRMFHNLVRVGIEPDRQMWRQWMRVKLMAAEFLNAVRALWRYKMCESDGEGEEADFGEEACIYLAARMDKIREGKKVLLETILFDISRAVSIGLKHADCERLYMLHEAGTVPLAAQTRVISLHEQLVRSVCESQPEAPNRLKVAAAIHMHLLHCVKAEELPQDAAAGVARLEETIATAFWKGGRDEQMRMLCKQRYNKAWPPRWARLPVVKSQKLARAWLARGLAQRQLSFDLGHTNYADVGAQLAHAIDTVQKKEKAGDDDDNDAALMKFFRDTAAQVKFKEEESLNFGPGERKAAMVEEAAAAAAKKAEAEKGAHGSSGSNSGGGSLPIRHVPLRTEGRLRVRKP